MDAWWEALTILQKVLYCIAIPATLVLIIQTVLVIMGFGDGASGADFNPSDTSGLDLDTSGDVSGGDLIDADIGDAVSGDFGNLKLFTVQGAVAFLATFSWVSIVCVKADLHEAVALLIGFVSGLLVMYGVAKLLQLTAKLAENGTFRIKSIIGETAQVYLTILPSGESGGKITVSGVSRFTELDAITDSTQAIPSGARVRIVDVRGDVAVVEKDL